jgi:hypothetical protein
MVNYYDIMEPARDGRAPPRTTDGLDKAETVVEPNSESLGALAPIPVLAQASTPFKVARTRSLQFLNERVARLAGVGQSVRLLVTGGRPGDDASTVADLEERYSFRGARNLALDQYPIDWSLIERAEAELHMVDGEPVIGGRRSGVSPRLLSQEPLARLECKAWREF